MKKWKNKGILFLIICLLCSGCAHSNRYYKKLAFLDEEGQDTIQMDIESIRLAGDLDLFIEFYNQMKDEIAEVENGSSNSILAIGIANTGDGNLSSTDRMKARLAIQNYVRNMAQLAAVRLSSDIDGIYLYSDEYMNYMAMLQKFTDAYASEKEALKIMIQEGNSQIDTLTSYQMLCMMEGYYMDLLQNQT